MRAGNGFAAGSVFEGAASCSGRSAPERRGSQSVALSDEDIARKLEERGNYRIPRKLVACKLDLNVDSALAILNILISHRNSPRRWGSRPAPVVTPTACFSFSQTFQMFVVGLITGQPSMPSHMLGNFSAEAADTAQ
jgi:hypothetical protein